MRLVCRRRRDAAGAYRVKLPSSWEWWYHEQPDDWVFHISFDSECEWYAVYNVPMGDINYIGKQHWSTNHDFPDNVTCVLVSPEIDGVLFEATPYPLAVSEFAYPGVLLALLVTAWELVRKCFTYRRA